MTTSIDPVLLARLSGEFTTLGTQLGVLGRDLELLREQVAANSGVQRDSGPSVAPGAFGTGEARGSVSGVPDAAVAGGSVPGGGGIRASGAPAESTSSGAAVGGGSVPGGESGVPVESASGAGGGAPVARSSVPGKSGVAWGVPGEPASGATGRPVAGAASTDSPARGEFAGSEPAPSGAVPPVMPPWPGHSPTGGMPVPPPQPAYAPRFAPPGGAWGGAPWPPNAQGLMPGAVPPRPPVPPRARPSVPHTPWWQRDGVISRILALAGVGVTLIGVAMLLVLAAQAGFFGPVPRVVAGAVFSVALVGAGVRVFGQTGGRVGGIALAATGIAGAYLDVVAVTAIYHWLHPVLGLAVAFGVAAAGVALAMQWRSQPFAVLVVLAAAALSPVLTTRLVLLAFLIVLQSACVPVQLTRNWPYLHVARTLPAVLATFAFITAAVVGTPDAGERITLLVAAAAVALVGLAGTIVVVRHRPDDLTASLTMAAALVPVLLAPGMFEERAVAVAVATVAATVLLLVAAMSMVPKLNAAVRLPGHTALVAAVAGSIALLEACVGATETRTLPTALFLVALTFLGVAGQRISRTAAGIGAAFAVLGGFALLNIAGPEVLASQHRSETNLGVATVLGAVLALGVVAVALWCARRMAGSAAGSEWQWITASVAGLYAVTATTVSIGVATGTPNGFLIGHSGATILWMAAATGALLFGLRRLATAPAVAKLALGSGLPVTAAALAKLFLFDLATLDGLVRVAAFLVVGILLLLAGTRYARAFADAGASRDPHAE
ncbi:DUF2339 domain-containing protein [Nocardia gipuzkoensis]|uniref:DUF2339 domain-containing protein n=1 Tax=Nocardia gipuzkoensis TaxID=2749991 RepID=UPI001E63FBD4|nr:DUF2339 domain-containing protein [Nocardia gipuzkoensis]UGT70598.1 DUF2339 domain-containing protein [Nocardia gipuzkoensis]